MRPRAIIFDLDGTLIDSAMLAAGIVNAMLAERGAARLVTPEQARAVMTHEGAQMIAALLASDGGDPTNEIAEFRRHYASRPTPEDCLFAGVRDGIERLHGAGWRLAICSNKPQSLCEKVLGDLALADRFEVIVGGAPRLRAKPAPDLLDRTLDLLALPAAACVYVGDSDLDHAVASAAGVPFLYAGYGYGDPAWSAPGLRHFASFADAIDAIETFGRPAALAA